MKAEVIRAYTDRLDKTVHLKGSFVDLDGDRLMELAGKGIVKPPTDEPAADFAGMTVAELKEYIDGHGGTYARGARKAELAAIAEGL